MITLPFHSTLERATLAGAEAAHHFASVLRSQYEAFWSRDTATVLAELNANIAQNVAIFELNTQAGTAVNLLLDALNDPRFSTRAPVTMPNNWAFVDGQFAYIQPVEEVAE
jgi:hypothetical protein